VTPNLATYTAAVNVQVPEADRAKIDPDHEKDLRWYFNHADSEALARFALYSQPTWHCADVQEAGNERYMTVSNPRWTNIRRALRAMPEPHYDVLGWCFEQREYLRSTNKVPHIIDDPPSIDVYRAGAVDIMGAEDDSTDDDDTNDEGFARPRPKTRKRRVKANVAGSGLLPGWDVDGKIPFWECDTAEKNHRFLLIVGEWPGVAIRTLAAYRARALDEGMRHIDLDAIMVDKDGRVSHGTRFLVVTGNHPSLIGMPGFIMGLPKDSVPLAAIKSETNKRVRAAFDAYGRARKETR